ncbi:MAG: hypothetical protein ACC651_07275 [Candidatus Scalindua sp.]
MIKKGLVETEAGLKTKNTPIGDIIADPKFLEEGKFPELPGNLELPRKLYFSNHSRNQKIIPIEEARSSILKTLDRSMGQHWDFLYERANLEANKRDNLNINTLSRYVYNTFCVREILKDLDERNVGFGRILLVTAYETPIQELLESERVGEVHVVDLSQRACEVISEKYAGHNNAGKLHIRILDYSCIDPHFQEDEITQLIGNLDKVGIVDKNLLEHFAKIASGKYFSALDFEGNSFDAVHLPFVLGSFHLTPFTAVIDHYRFKENKSYRVEYQEFISEKVLVSEEVQKSAIAVINHVISETKRILVKNGLIVINLWARPVTGKKDMVKLSDIVVPVSVLNNVLYGFSHLFSGNPQPNLPQTVGHILRYQNDIDTIRES